MSLAPGARLGPYEIIAAIGAGGMGEVYRAHDTRLGRDVAVKVIPVAFASDPERLARFEQEAQAAAALNHPNILAVHDIGTDAGAPYIVSELLVGESLRDRLARGALPVRKAIDYAVQVAHGLAAAHDRRIIHRDLKPDNIFVTAEGRVKILDFGLAKLTETAPALTGLSVSPTMPRGTAPGLVLGTVGYMAPEQVRGQPADHRSDIFAFGAILSEMLSGLSAFAGDTPIDAMTAVLKEEPRDLTAIDLRVPSAIARIVDRCLEKNPAGRFQSAGDLRFALEALSTLSDVSSATVIQARRYSKSVWGTVAVLAVLLAGATAWYARPRPIAAPLVHAAIPLSQPLETSSELPAIAISPDGGRVVYRSATSGALFMRTLDQRDSAPIAGTEGAREPFFSADGQWVGFFVDAELKKVSVTSGAVVAIASLPLTVGTGVNGYRGASWSDDGTIVFAPAVGGGLFLVSDQGGKPRAVTSVDTKRGETSHRWPEVLPGGKAVVFTIKSTNIETFDDAQIVVRSLVTGEQRSLAQGGFARYAPTGHLIYGRGGALYAVSFDVDRLTITGPTAKVLDGVITHPSSGAAQFAVSKTGSLVYVAGDSHTSEGALLLVDRGGRAKRITERQADFGRPRVSPDGRRIALYINGAYAHIWILDVVRGTYTRTALGGDHYSPVWTPDGLNLTIGADLTGTGVSRLFSEPLDGSRQAQLLFDSARSLEPLSWSSDGQLLLYQQFGDETKRDLWIYSIATRQSKPFAQAAADDFQGRFSPDGHWVAYVSKESGRDEIYVRPFPGPGARSQISTEGGTAPIWSRDGREMFFVRGDGLYMVPVATSAAFSSGTSHLLFSGPYDLQRGSYDVMPDGQHFIVLGNHADATPRNLDLVLNWFDELKRLAPIH